MITLNMNSINTTAASIIEHREASLTDRASIREAVLDAFPDPDYRPDTATLRRISNRIELTLFP